MPFRSSSKVQLTFNGPDVIARAHDAIVDATREVFGEIEISAAERVAVLDKETSERFPGELRDSIKTTVRKVKQGVRARLFTETDAEWRSKNSLKKGYGGFLELGTAKEPAEPFLWPAFEEHIGDLGEAVREKLNEE